MGCLASKESPTDRQQQQFRDELPRHHYPRSVVRVDQARPPYAPIDQVREALEQAGLRSLNLILGVAFTRSNEWTGRNSFQGLNLHHTDDFQNPYEHAISIIAEPLSRFNHNSILCYGFGDESTQDVDVFSFYSGDRPCNDFTELTNRYRELAPHVKLSGPTSFAPIIEMAMTIVENTGGQYHLLIIVADGQVPRSIETAANLLSPEEQRTFDALEEAGKFPLSILLVGVGDGPWDRMKNLGEPFPNFQFVNYTEIMSGYLPDQPIKEATFASIALSGIPSQCVMITGSGILGRQTGRSPNKVAFPPPHGISYPPSPIFSDATAPPYADFRSGPSSAESSFNALAQQHVCPVCLENPKDMAFGCGHQTCIDCSHNLDVCPICRRQIQSRLRLY